MYVNINNVETKKTIIVICYEKNKYKKIISKYNYF